MRDLRLNFVTRKTHTSLGGSLLLFGSVAMLVWYLNDTNTSQVLDRLEEQRNRVFHPKTIQKHPENTALTDAVLQEKTLQSKIQQSLATPWPALFDSLEKSHPSAIRINEIAPDPMSHTLQLKGETNEMEDVLDYVDALNKEPALHDVNLLSHELTAENNATFIAFEIEAQWN